jgi:hypothetical protein
MRPPRQLWVWIGGGVLFLIAVFVILVLSAPPERSVPRSLPAGLRKPFPDKLDIRRPEVVRDRERSTIRKPQLDGTEAKKPLAPEVERSPE